VSFKDPPRAPGVGVVVGLNLLDDQVVVLELFVGPVAWAGAPSVRCDHEREQRERKVVEFHRWGG